MSNNARDSVTRSRSLIVAALAMAVAPTSAHAQAWFYPSFQTPTTVEREYNFAAVAASGADLLFQWREGLAPGTQVSLDAGLADPKGASNTRLFVGGQYAQSIMRATKDQPLDVLGTVGVGASFGGGAALFRIPLGVSVGHTFPLDEGMSVTPYVHPRLSLDAWTSGDHHQNVSLDFDLGASLVVTPQLAVRASVIFSGNDATSGTGVGIGLAVTPPGLRRP
jgi:hypothetical protein